MFDLKSLKNEKEIIEQIDWEITPREVFEIYQLKSVNNWKYGTLSELYYFYISTWKDETKLFLMKKTLKESEEIAEIDCPSDLMQKAIKSQEGQDMPRGQLPLTREIKDWLTRELTS